MPQPRRRDRRLRQGRNYRRWRHPARKKTGRRPAADWWLGGAWPAGPGHPAVRRSSRAAGGPGGWPVKGAARSIPGSAVFGLSGSPSVHRHPAPGALARLTAAVAPVGQRGALASCPVDTSSVKHHGCHIGRGSIVEPGAIVCHGSVVGAESVVRAGACIKQCDRFGDRYILDGFPARLSGRIPAGGDTQSIILSPGQRPSPAGLGKAGCSWPRPPAATAGHPAQKGHPPEPLDHTPHHHGVSCPRRSLSGTGTRLSHPRFSHPRFSHPRFSHPSPGQPWLVGTGIELTGPHRNLTREPSRGP
jgi:hypothetical protein